MSVILGDCIEEMAKMEADSVDAIVTDPLPPYGLEFMGKEWDRLGDAGFHAPKDEGRTFTNASGHMFDNLKSLPRYGRPSQMQAWHERWATEAFRLAKPSAYLLAFGGTRTVHRMACAIEDAGWLIRDMLVWAYACLSDDTEILTSEGWVRHHSASEGQHAAAFDPESGVIRWEPIKAVHRYDHEGPMALVGPQLVTLNHRVILEPDATTVPCLPGVWNHVPTACRMVAEGSTPRVLAGVQREAATSGPSVSHRDTGRLDDGVGMLSIDEDVWPAQPGLEGRSYRVQEAWQLLGRPLPPGASLGSGHGSQGRVRDGAPADRGRDLRLPPDPDRMREPRGSSADEQRPGQPDALAGQPDAQALRVGQVPAGDGEPDAVRLDGYRGIVWCITVPSGAFVARRNGVVFVTGNSGFPKSKSSLKPAWEPIVMARKPGPLRELAIDACRIGTGGDKGEWPSTGRPPSMFADGAKSLTDNSTGRWPANVILTDPIFDGGWDGVVGGGSQEAGFSGNGTAPTDGHLFAWGRDDDMRGYGDSGTYSRFFLVPKADRAEREPIWEAAQGLERGPAGTMQGNLVDGQRLGGDGSPIRTPIRANVHPTVKPLELMRHLVRLVTPSTVTELYCPVCEGERERYVPTVRGNGSAEAEPAVLLGEMSGAGGPDAGQDLPDMRDGVLGQGPHVGANVLLAEVRADRPDKAGRALPRVRQGLPPSEGSEGDPVLFAHLRGPSERSEAAEPDAEHGRLPLGVEPDSSERGQVGLRNAASPGDGGRDGTASDQGRGSRPHQRDKGRQPAGELTGADGPAAQQPAEASSSAHRVSALPRDPSDLGPCPTCRSPLAARSRPGLILDPFLGSGTTGIAAEMEGFRWLGIEREAEYVKIAEARLHGTQRGLGLPA